jgi:hypothetical protein
LVASHPPPLAAGDAGGAGDGHGAGADGGGAEGAAAGAGANWDGRGGIDDDEHLAAYNAFLARLNEAEPGRRQRQ